MSQSGAPHPVSPCSLSSHVYCLSSPSSRLFFSCLLSHVYCLSSHSSRLLFSCLLSLVLLSPVSCLLSLITLLPSLVLLSPVSTYPSIIIPLPLLFFPLKKNTSGRGGRGGKRMTAMRERCWTLGRRAREGWRYGWPLGGAEVDH